MTRKPRPMVVGPRPRGGKPVGPGGALLRLLAVAGLGWVAGLLWFSLSLPGVAPLSTRTDAVVVLTGGTGRLARGVAVLQTGAAPRMLISGVKRSSSMAMIAEAADIPMSAFATTDLGYGAVDTRSNAEETASWVSRRKVRSLRLVTSSGHMRRARMELARVLPDEVLVVPDAVPHEVGAPGIPWEYTKFLARWAALNIGLG